jgi:phosphatidylinositol 4-kinase
VKELKSQLAQVSETLRKRTRSVSCEELRPLLYRAAAVILAKEELDHQLLREVVFIPVHAVNPSAMHLGVEVWAWLVDKRADVESKLMVDLNLAWGWSIRRRRGLFSILLK